MCDFSLKKDTPTVKLMDTLPEKFQKQLIQLAITSLKNQTIDFESVTFEGKDNYSTEQLYDLLGLHISLIKLLIHTSPEEFRDKLIQSGFSQSCINRFPLKHENKLAITQNTNLGHNLSSLRWSVDTSVANSIGKKKVAPWIIISITLNSGKQYMFVADIHQFHNLRFNVALVLKEMLNLKLPTFIRK